MNPTLTLQPSTNPAQLLRYRDRQYAAELLTAAIVHLDLFTWLKNNPGVSTGELRGHFDFAERPTDVLLTLARANELIQTTEDRHSITPLAEEFLSSDSPWNLQPYYAPIQDSQITKDFLTVLQTGKPANWQAQDHGSDWHTSMHDEDFALSFTQIMNCRGLAFGQKLAKALTPQLENKFRLLDVGGGSGIYASTMIAAHPHLTGMVMEQSPVDAIAIEEIAKHGLAEKLKVITADMFKEDWPKCDVLLLSNVLHDWDIPEVRKLCENATAALSKDGLLIIHEAFINDDKTGPLPVAEYSALLMNITQGKCYCPNEYVLILKELGFDVGPYQDTIADRGFMTATKR
jgi:2-polyprenyl-3-methyl-5-hydroxy-6-metoxy-1,4-benzoquinol methylase